MPKSTSVLKNKWVIVGAGVLAGASFLSYAMLINPQGDDLSIEGLQERFKDSDVKLTNTLPDKSAESNAQLEAVPKANFKPEFVTAPDYKTAIAIAKIYEYALNPAQEETWLRERLATRAQREATLRAQSRQAEAKAELERERYIQQKQAIENGTAPSSFSQSAASRPNERMQNETALGEIQPVVKIRGYAKASKFTNSSAALEVDGEVYQNLVEGSNVAGISITELDDHSECVSLVNTKTRSGANSKYCM